MAQLVNVARELDDRLSNRFIELDGTGYFLIYVDRDRGVICADHYSNRINDQGLACDPETGEPLPCNAKVVRDPTVRFQGRSAKELCIEVFEKSGNPTVSRFDHAAYLGREFVRAEMALFGDEDYVQD
jgi:dihydropteroate synthase